MNKQIKAPGGWRASISGTVTVEVAPFRTRQGILTAVINRLITEWRANPSRFEGPNAQAFMYQRSAIKLDAATLPALEDWVDEFGDAVTSPVVTTRHGAEQ